MNRGAEVRAGGGESNGSRSLMTKWRKGRRGLGRQGRGGGEGAGLGMVSN